MRNSILALAIVALAGSLVFNAVDRRVTAGEADWKRVVVTDEVVVGAHARTPSIDVRGWGRIAWQVTSLEGNVSFYRSCARVYAQQNLQPTGDSSSGCVGCGDTFVGGTVGHQETVGSEMAIEIHGNGRFAVTAFLAR